MAVLPRWNRQANEVGWTALLGERRGTADVPAYAAPARAEDLGALPPTFIDVGSADTFRDECVDYASRIWRAGGVAELHVWPGGYHGFEFFAPQARMSRQCLAARRDWLLRLLTD
jgi:acetyl esterase/lipase